MSAPLKILFCRVSSCIINVGSVQIGKRLDGVQTKNRNIKNNTIRPHRKQKKNLLKEKYIKHNDVCVVLAPSESSGILKRENAGLVLHLYLKLCFYLLISLFNFQCLNEIYNVTAARL